MEQENGAPQEVPKKRMKALDPCFENPDSLEAAVAPTGEWAPLLFTLFHRIDDLVDKACQTENNSFELLKWFQKMEPDLGTGLRQDQLDESLAAHAKAMENLGDRLEGLVDRLIEAQSSAPRRR